MLRKMLPGSSVPVHLCPRTLLLALFLASCLASTAVMAEIYSTRFDGVTWDNANWVLKTMTLDQGHYQSRMSLANGYLGINLAAVGPFFDVDRPVNGDMINGWPLFGRRQTFATISGFWDSQPTTNASNFPWLSQYGGESVISGVPHWAGLTIQTAAGHVLNSSVDASQISNFSSAVDFRAGLMTWNYTWTPPAATPLSVEYTMLVHKLYVNQAAVQLRVTADVDVNLTVTDILDGDCAVRTDFVAKGSDNSSSSSSSSSGTIWTAVSPFGIGNVTAYLYSTLAGRDLSAPPAPVTDSALVTGIGTSNQSSIAQSAPVSLRAGTTSTITKFIGGASTDAFADPQSVARKASLSAAAADFDSLLHSHRAEWASILTKDSVDLYSFPENGTLPPDPYVIERQITSITNPFHILQNTVGPGALSAARNNTMLNVNSVSVGGLGSDSYAGLVFWDADVWMSPGLTVAFPQTAATFHKYRTRLFPQAQSNIAMAFSSSQNATAKFSPAAAVYPWTSGRFGNCTATGPCFDYEYHINGDIGLDLYNHLVVTGDEAAFRDNSFPVHDAIATFYSDLLTLNETSGRWALTNATDPDEFANHVDNPGYTLALIETHLNRTNAFRSRFGLEIDAEAANKSANLDIPVSESADIILEYETMDGTISIKQADVILVDDFLAYPNPHTLSSLEYYASKQSQIGPGMTYGVFSIVANAFSPSGCSAYTYSVYASHPYVRGPWFQYSEQLIDDVSVNGGFHPAFPFLTGMGGANRIGIFGWLGLRLRPDSLNIDPALPPQIANIDYRTFYWQGHAINAVSNTTHTVLSRLPPAASLPSANKAYLTSPIPLTIGTTTGKPSTAPAAGGAPYQLSADGTPLTIPNRNPAGVKTWAGNAAQCQPATTAQDIEPGQFAFAVNDGAVSTKWQPAAAKENSSVTVDLGGGTQGRRVAGVRFDWAAAPPRGYAVTFSNDSSASWCLPPPPSPSPSSSSSCPSSSSSHDAVEVIRSDSVTISAPYDPATAARITRYQSNTTNVTLTAGPVLYAGRYATLTIWGNQATGDDGVGATVAEFAVILEGGDVGNAAGSSGVAVTSRASQLRRHSTPSFLAFLVAFVVAAMRLV